MQEGKDRSTVMITYTIKKHVSSYTPNKPHLFALSHGYNAGRPYWKPSADCFVIICETEDDKRKMFFILDGIWRCQIFRRQLHGSVLPALHVHEFTATVNRYWTHIHECERRVDRLIGIFSTIDELQHEIAGLNRLLDSYRSVAYIDVLKTKETDF